MKALLLEGKGLADEMKVGELEKPKPGQGEILVKIKAAALNPVDYKTANGGNYLLRPSSVLSPGCAWKRASVEQSDSAAHTYPNGRSYAVPAATRSTAFPFVRNISQPRSVDGSIAEFCTKSRTTSLPHRLNPGF